MPHGPTSRDAKDFAPKAMERLGRAAEDLRVFRGRGYGVRESLQLVGNRFRLTKRQRQFLYRCVSPPECAARRRAKLVAASELRGRTLWVDGHNCLIITETAIAGGAVMVSDDGVVRDVQGVYGAYRFSSHTDKALALLTEVLVRNPPCEAVVYLDRKMRFAQRVCEDWQHRFADAGLAGRFAAVDHADEALRNAGSDVIVATNDRENMDAATTVVDLPAAAVADCERFRLLDVGAC